MPGRTMGMSVVAVPQEEVDPTNTRQWWSDEGLIEALGIIRGTALVLLAEALLGLLGHHVANWW